MSDGKRDNGERWIRCRASSELATVRDKQVTDIVCLTPLITNTVAGTRALPASAKIMGRRAWRNSNDSDRADRLKHSRALNETMLSHRNVVRMIIEMNVGNRHVELVLFAWMQRNAADATGFFRIPANRIVELGARLEL